jgi:hypothetical protein
MTGRGRRNRPPYEIGYRRPPKASQFQKGVSGNPRGRPKGSRNISSVLAAALNERVSVNQNGKRKTITKLEAAVTQVANQAAGGDARAIKMILDFMTQAEQREQARADAAPASDEDRRKADKAILAGLAQRLKGDADG